MSEKKRYRKSIILKRNPNKLVNIEKLKFKIIFRIKNSVNYIKKFVTSKVIKPFELSNPESYI